MQNRIIEKSLNSHTIESTMPVWEVIEADPKISSLFIEGRPWCHWCSNKAQLRILDKNTRKAASALGTLAHGTRKDILEGLQSLAWSCDAIAREQLKKEPKK